jgi:5-methylcytosine-specific restriction endonuclease McrA
LENYRNNRPARLASMRLWNAKIKANRIKLEPQTLEQKLAKSRIKWRDNKDAFVAYKGGECVCCGYSRTSSALEFHHVIPSDKEFSISCSSSLEKVYYELDKCVLLCSNCHREVHSGFINIPRDALVTWANAM